MAHRIPHITRALYTRALHTRSLHTRSAHRFSRAKRLVALVVVAVLVAGGVPACDQRPRDVASSTTSVSLPDTIWVSSAWVRAGDSAATTGAYATIHNPRDSAVQIVGARTAAADTVELHETMQHDGMVHMEAQTMVTLPARDSLVFAPGGKHFMVRGLRRTLVQGEQLLIQLLLNNGDSVNVSAAVRSITGQ